MSKQIGVYLLPDDLSELEPLLRKGTDITITGSRTPSAYELDERQNLVERPRSDDPLKVFFLRAADRADVSLQSVDGQSFWVLDELRSPVVELSRCYYNGTELRRGRFYFHQGYWGGDEKWVDKSKGFVEWANRTFSAIRRSLSRDAGLDAYLGPHAKAWIARGGSPIL